MATRTNHQPMSKALAAMAAMAVGTLLLLIHGTTALPAQAQSTTGATITVNTDRDVGFNDEYCSLREAVEAANDNQATVACPAGSATGEDTIVFQPGTGTNIELVAQLSVTDAAGLVIDGGAKTRITVSHDENASEDRIFFLFSDAKLALRNLNVFNGDVSVDRDGGAIVNRGTLEVTNSAFSNNSADDGGAIYNLGTLKVTNSTFSNNSVDVYGGAVFNSGTLGVANSTFSGNSATYGGGIYNGGAGNTATLRSTILAKNASGGNCYGTIADGGYNIEDTNACGFAQANNSKPGTDPKLETDANGNPVLRHNGGPTQTIALLQDSPAKDAIPEGTNGCGTDITTDQRGVKRPQWSACDAGAFEIEKPNDPPVANDDEAATDEDTATDVDVLTNDSDSDGDALSVESFTDPANGRVTKNPDGTLRYEPDKDFGGEDSFTYTVSDAKGGTDTAAVTIAVAPVNDAPTISDIRDRATDEDTATPDISFTVGDVETPAGSLKVTGSSSNSTLVPDANIAFGGSGANRTVTVTPAPNRSGTATITMSVSDGAATTNDTFVLTVTAINDAPVIGSVTNSGPVGEGSPATITVTTADVEGDTLSYEFDCNNDGAFEIGPQPANDARCTFDDDGTHRVNVRVSDGNGGTLTDFANVTVNNVAPNAANDPASAQEGGSNIMIDVLANDTDVSGDSLTITGNTQPPAGEGSANCSNSDCAFTPDADFNGNTSFTYTISDGDGGTDTATVTITVTPVNDAPTVALAAGGQCGASATTGQINLTVGDIESAAGALTLSATSSNQRLVPNSSISSGGSGAGRTLTVNAQPKRSGTATITLTVSDGEKMDSIPITVKVGTDSKDTLTGTMGADIIFGKHGNDTINALDGNDLICGGNGAGTMSGGAGDDTLDGAKGNDVLRGDEGKDILRGGSGDDTLTGGTEADSFSGGSGTDAATDFNSSEGDAQDGTIP